MALWQTAMRQRIRWPEGRSGVTCLIPPNNRILRPVEELASASTQRPIAKALHLLPMIGDDGVNLRRGEVVFPATGATLAEEACRRSRPFGEAAGVFHVPETLEGRLFDRLAEFLRSRREAQKHAQRAERLIRRGQHVLVAHHMEGAVGFARPTHDMLAPGT